MFPKLNMIAMNKQKNRIGERNGMWREKPERWSLEEL